MDLEDLLKAMEAAKATALAKPDDKALQTAFAEAEKAYNDAKAAAEADPNNEEHLEDDPKLDEKTKAYIAKLRKENASARTKNKDLASKFKISEDQKKAILKAAGIETEEDDPAEKIKTLSAQSDQLALRSTILESAIQQGIKADDLEFYQFLVSKALADLKDEEELDEEKLAEIVKKVNKASTKGAGSSVGTGKDGKKPPNPEGNGEVTLDQFIRMSITEKSVLYEKNPDLYKELVAEAKAKRKLV